ncbi:MAG: diaminopimelate decarboxylase [Planctomycetes bacterium]|nr:diaminopimelate decarboxylase [Planctomycetota bacterium]
MDHFSYEHGALRCEGVAVADVAATVGTPCYVYSAGTLAEHHRRTRDAFAALDPLICYSVKSCGNLGVLRTLTALGSGMDVVSGGELFRARAAGCPPERIVYAGVGKRDDEIAAALDAGIHLLNVESEQEFENIARIARGRGATCRCALRINPDVDPRTHRFTTTGTKETKFGVDIERARAFFRAHGRDPHARLVGLHLHIGSPVTSTDPYVQAVTKALALREELLRDGFEVSVLDVGGGFAADYETGRSPAASDYARAIVPLLEPAVRAGLRIVLEPGRSIAANAGILLTRVQYVKTSGDRTFAICDAGMNALLRPSHYDAFHFIWPAAPGPGFAPHERTREPGMPGLVTVDVVGPLCETGDYLALDRRLPPPARGDLLAVFTAGAYGMSMASRYNSSPLPAEVLVSGEAFTVVRRRETYEDLVAHER